MVNRCYVLLVDFGNAVYHSTVTVNNFPDWCLTLELNDGVYVKMKDRTEIKVLDKTIE